MLSTVSVDGRVRHTIEKSPHDVRTRGRDKQLQQIEEALDNLSRTRRSMVLTVRGAHGTGKTRLLLDAISAAVRNGCAVVNSVTLATNRRAGAAPPRRSHTGQSGAGLEDLPTRGPLAMVEDLSIRLREAPAEGQVLVVVDDLHLMDAAASYALCDLIVTTGRRPILWALALSDGSDAVGRSVIEDHLRRLDGERIKLTPLSRIAVGEILADHLRAIPDPAIVTLVHSVCRTPREVIGLASGLLADGAAWIVDGRALLSEASAPARPKACFPTPPSVPERYARIVLETLQSLSPATIKALKLAAVLGSPFTPKKLSAMLAESPAELLAAMDEALARGLIVCGDKDFAFQSEPIWRVVLDSVPQPMAALLHRQAAEVLMSEPDGIEMAARHLAHIAQPGDARAVEAISNAAGQLLASDPAAAASLALRGVDLLLADPSQRVVLATTAAEAFVRAGEPGKALHVAEDALGQLGRLTEGAAMGGRETTAALRSWASVALLLEGRPHDAAITAAEVLAVPGAHPAHRDRATVASLVSYCLTDETLAAGLADEVLNTPGGHRAEVEATALTVRAIGQWRDGLVNEALRTLEKGTELVRGTAQPHLQLLDPRWIFSSLLLKIGEPDRALALIETTVPANSVAVLAALRASAHLALGRLEQADSDACTAIEMADGRCLPVHLAQAWHVRVMAALRRGAVQVAQEHFATMERLFPRDTSRPWWAMQFLLKAHISQATLGVAEALDGLTEIWAGAGARRELLLESPSVSAMCVRWAVETGQPEIARLVVQTADTIAARNPGLLALGVGAMHARALLDRDAETLDRAGHAYRDPWAQAATAEDYGRLRLADQDQEAAVAGFERAMERYASLGSERDTARLRRQLRDLGVRRRHWTYAKRPESGWDSLTTAERNVAELVASGLTNREVAGRLFISPHTAGFHLRQVYRKLDMRSRMDLVRFKAS